MDKIDILKEVDALKDVNDETCQIIWDNPEISGQESASSKYYMELMEKHGFEITVDEKLPTAFMAKWGSGSPVVAILGEYDALPGLSQEVSSSRSEVTAGGAGHGCGHNMLGSGSATGAIAIKNVMEKEGIKGEIRFYGCPEEEILSGKVKMIHHEMFEGCDFAICWHPYAANMVFEEAFLANASCRFFFHGVSSHAGYAPQNGRSALDAVELMNVGVQYLREHVIDRTRIHYSTHGDSFAPNIVPPEAHSWYYVRAPHMRDVKDTLSRIEKCAQGAATMTETSVDIELDAGCCEMLSNSAFASLTQRNFEEIPRSEYSDDEISFARELQNSVSEEILKKDKAGYSQDGPMFEGVASLDQWKSTPLNASSDVGDISMVMPMCMFATACWPIGVAPHTWQATASGGSFIGKKGALLAAKVIAGVAYDLLTDAKIGEEIKAEFESKRPKDYEPMLGEKYL